MASAKLTVSGSRAREDSTTKKNSKRKQCLQIVCQIIVKEQCFCLDFGGLFTYLLFC